MIGVVGAPMIFGRSASFDAHMAELKLYGYAVHTVDLYNHQPFKQPWWGSLVIGPGEQQKLNALAGRFIDERILKQFSDAFARLRAQGCQDIYALGFGYGGICALWFAQSLPELAGAIAWYPHLIFPPEVPKEPPSLGDIRCPSLLFYGEQDKKIEPYTIDVARAVKRIKPNLEVVTYPKTGHAFADRCVQGRCPSPLYNQKAAEDSWNAALAWMDGQTNQSLRLRLDKEHRQ
jgi:dienelactone hydrolase